MTQVSFGFVAICLSEQKCSPAGNVTVKSVEGMDAAGVRHRIVDTAARNIENTIRIMHFLRGNNLQLYRISANLIPLATHPLTDDFEWWNDPTLSPLLAKLGELVREYQVRLSSHLPQVCVLSSPKDSVLEWLFRYVEYHRRLFTAIGVDEQAKLILHVGGAYNNPGQALRQAEENFHRLDSWTQSRLVLENDDKSFTARQVLTLTERLGIPMVFDFHHYMAHNEGEGLDEFESLFSQAFAAWHGRPPKVHLSSPKSPEQIRAHADHVDWEFVSPFFDLIQRISPDHLDVMVEAKKKDLAALALREEYHRAFSNGSPASKDTNQHKAKQN